MRSLDFAPLYRATVGFDRIADLMDRVLTSDVAQPTYPPYNIEKTAENAYRISIAVAGFRADELSVEVKDGTLHVAARKATERRRPHLPASRHRDPRLRASLRAGRPRPRDRRRP